MDVLQIREPINALSHGLGMILALAGTWALAVRLRKDAPPGAAGYRRGKTGTLLLYGACLSFCYGASALFHALPIPPGSGNVFHRLDHVGIYLLIAGTYTPVAWSMMHGRRRGWTLAAVWIAAIVCAGRVGLGGLLPIGLSTLIYLTMGWAALACYRDLMRRHPHRILTSLPVGGFFYSVGAVVNLSKHPVLIPGVFASHELFHFFVLAGSACHYHFMYVTVVAAVEPNPAAAPDLDAPLPAGAIPAPNFLRRLPVSQVRTYSLIRRNSSKTKPYEQSRFF